MVKKAVLKNEAPTKIGPCSATRATPAVARYRSVWVIKQGLEAYGVVKTFSGFDFFDFLKRNREDFRKPVIELLRSLTK